MSRYMIPVLVALALIATFHKPAQAGGTAAVYSTFPGPEQGGWCIGRQGNAAGVALRTPAGDDWVITEARLRLGDSSLEAGTEFTLRVYEDDAGLPGDPVGLVGTGFGTWDGGETFDIYTLTPPDTLTLSADSVYWFLAESDAQEDTTCSFGWSYNGEEPSGDFQYVAEANRFSGNWTDRTGTYQQFEVFAVPFGEPIPPAPAPLAVPTFSTYALIMLAIMMLLIAGWTNWRRI